MNQISLWRMVFCSLFMVGASVHGQSNLNVVPKPNRITASNGLFLFKNGATIYAQNYRGAAALLEKKLSSAAGILLLPVADPEKAEIVLSINPSNVSTAEGYRMVIDTKKVTIEAANETGIYYGVQTLLQLLPAQIESKTQVAAKWSVPCLTIEDAPRFPYRGIMLDCCRHFSSIDHIKRLLDVFASYKINRFHWHLTDDQGWRIEIKKYPKLTQIGSKRTEYDGSQYGDFYTQEQIKDIVEYAAVRHIEVIPEIEMPGHGMAALTAYPEYSCTGGPFKVRTIWGVENDVYCAGNDATYTFLSDILDEVCALFPSKYIHIGGDECPKDRWKNCPKCQGLMKAQGLKNENELQGYFTRRMEKILEQKGKKIIGWDEILEGGIAQSATIMSWRGEQGGIEAANAGHDVVMTPGSYVYLDYYQGSPLCEPVKIGGLTTLQKIYEYDPVPKAIAADKTHHVLGLQGNLWTEYLYTPDEIDYQLFPKTTAIAETGWTNPENKQTTDFVRRMDDQQIRWDKRNIDYYIPMPEGNTNYIEFTDNVVLPFTTNRPVKMVYTLDGSAPTAKSTAYNQPLNVDKTTVLNIRIILPQGKMSAVRTIRLTKTKPLASINIDNAKPGLKMQYVTEGKLQKLSELATVKGWKDTLVTNVNDFFKLKKPESPDGAAIYSGYIYVEKADTYVVHCLADQLILGEKLLINNSTGIKKYAPTDITLPLQAGYYPVKIVLLNRIAGGVPSSWVDARIMLRPANVTSSTTLTSAKVVYR